MIGLLPVRAPPYYTPVTFWQATPEPTSRQAALRSCKRPAESLDVAFDGDTVTVRVGPPGAAEVRFICDRRWGQRRFRVCSPYSAHGLLRSNGRGPCMLVSQQEVVMPAYKF